MSQNVSCPKCGHAFEVGAEFERYEKIVAEIVGGKLAPPRTAGYDVIDRDGVTTYQVKYSGARGVNKRGWIWQWNESGVIPDLFALFGGTNSDTFMFLVDYRSFIGHSTHRKIPRYRERLGHMVAAWQGINGWIWDYKVTPETFIQKRDELLRAQQLRLEIESQYAL